MREGVLHFMYFTKGDYVRTPEGVGVVVQDEDEITAEYDFCTSQILIQHKEGTSNNPSNRPIEIIRDYITSITEKEYNEQEVFASY